MNVWNEETYPYILVSTVWFLMIHACRFSSRRSSVQKEDIFKFCDNESSGSGDNNQSFENDDGSLQSFGSVTRILKKDKKTLKRMKTLSAVEFEKKSRNEMMLALFLYTFECISVTAFSAIMYQEYHFDKYREYLEQTFVGQFFSFVPFIESYYGVIGLMCGTVIVVVILSSILIITYYKRLHPRLNMFTGKVTLTTDFVILGLFSCLNIKYKI